MEDKEKKKYLITLVAISMVIVIALWLFVFYPVSKKRVSETSTQSTADLFSNIGKSEDSPEVEEAVTIQESTDDSFGVKKGDIVEEESAEEVEIPRLPVEEEVQTDTEATDKEQDNEPNQAEENQESDN